MKPLLLVKEICLLPWYGRDKRCLEVMILVLDQRVGPPRTILSRKSTLLSELKYKSFIQLPFHTRLRGENLPWIALESRANSFQGCFGHSSLQIRRNNKSFQLFIHLFFCGAYVTIPSLFSCRMSILCVIIALYGLIYM